MLFDGYPVVGGVFWNYNDKFFYYLNGTLAIKFTVLYSAT